MFDISRTMYEITHGEYYPQIFSVAVEASDHSEGYYAYVTFRGGHEAKLSGLTTHADTAEEAIQQMKLELDAHFRPPVLTPEQQKFLEQ
jgi:predicted RNase H-like HicB family nuclease